jgi:glyoxylase-like metal-dependent hydrolase (beta-lactamase superfamily II)
VARIQVCTVLDPLARAAVPVLAAAAAASATAQPIRAVPVADGAYVLQGAAALGSATNRNFIANASFVVTPEGVVVIDALGSPPLARELLAEIRRVTAAPVRYVIVTHYHADHIYGLQVFEDEGATIVAHRAALDYLGSEAAQQRLQHSRDTMAPAIDAQTRLVPPRRVLDGPVTLSLGGTDFVVRPVGPAHTPEDLVVWVPQRRLLVVGDLVFRGRLPYVGLADSRRWIATLDTLLGYGAAVVVPGHGPVSTEARTDLQFTRDYLADLRRTMGAAAHALTPFAEAYARTDWSRWQQVPMFEAAHRANAYNTYLLMEREEP